MQHMKTNKQVSYDSTREMLNTIETSLNAGIGLYIHKRSCSTELVDIFSNLDLCVNYDKVLSIRNDIEKAVVKKMKTNNGVYVPSTLSPDEPVFFAIDNTDLKIDTSDGKGQLRGTAIAVFQQSNPNYNQPTLAVERNTSTFSFIL